MEVPLSGEPWNDTTIIALRSSVRSHGNIHSAYPAQAEPVDSRSSGMCSCVCSGAALNPQTPLASSERDELLSILSHELRTPVAVALGNLRLLLSGEGGALSPTQHEWTRTAEEYCSRLDQFMTDLVDVCHAGSIEAALDLTPGDLSSAIETVSYTHLTLPTIYSV